MDIEFPGLTEEQIQAERQEALGQGTLLADAGDEFARALLRVVKSDIVTPSQALQLQGSPKARKQSGVTIRTPAVLLQAREKYPRPIDQNPLHQRPLRHFLERRLAENGIEPTVFDIPAGGKSRPQLFVTTGVVLGGAAKDIRSALGKLVTQRDFLDWYDRLIFNADVPEAIRSWETELAVDRFRRGDKRELDKLNLYTAHLFESTVANAGSHRLTDPKVRALNFECLAGITVRASTLGALPLPESLVAPSFQDYVEKKPHYLGC